MRKRIWTSLPAPYTPIDWDNHLTNGLVSMLVPWEILPINAVTGNRSTYNPGTYNNPYPIVNAGAYGLGWYLGPNQRYSGFYGGPCSNLGKFEMIVCADGLLNIGQGFAGESTQDASVGTTVISNTTYAWGQINGQVANGTSILIIDQLKHTIGISCDYKSPVVVWLDGKTSGNSTGTPFHNNGEDGLGAGGGTGLNHIYHAMLYTGRTLTPEDRYAISQNPWQIFYRRQKVYSLPSIKYSIKFYQNGAFQANSFIQSAPADGSAFKIYLSNNDVQVSNVIATGSGLTKFFANGQIQANNLIHS